VALDSKTATVQERFDHLLAVISGQRFLNKQGLGNEVPFFLCAYDPTKAVEMAQMQRQLVKKLAELGIAVLEINLYDLCVEILQRRNLWDRILKIESEIDKVQLKELLQGPLDPERHLILAIAEKMRATDFQVMFIAGVGEVYPWIRSHTVLNNLQSTAKEQPTVMFFPGTYTQSLERGASLDLFGRLHDDKYYRAFDIDQYEA
jgi:hypothetical protein